MKRLIIGICAVCILALCVTDAVMTIRSQQRANMVRQFVEAGPANLAREEALARQEGIPLDPKQLQKPLPPPSYNAAPLYTQLTQLLRDKPLDLPSYAKGGMNSSYDYLPTQIEEVRALLASRPDVMGLIHQAADKPQCVFLHDWSTAMLTGEPLPELQTMHKAARFLQIESYLLAKQGRYSEAGANQARGFRVAEQAASEPPMISYLDGVSCQMMTLTGLQSILTLAGPNPSVCAQVKTILRTDGTPLSLKKALKTEPALMEPFFQEMYRAKNIGEVLDVMQSLTSGKGTSSPSPASDNSKAQNTLLTLAYPVSATGFVDAQKAEYLAEMRRFIEAADQPEPTRTAIYATAETANTGKPHQYVRIAALTFLPGMDKLGEDDLRFHARERILLIAANILAQKAKTGAYPAKLPQEFVDPFNNKPLQYQQEGRNGFVVYSVGPTGHFEGGKPGEKVPATELLFRYPAVAMPPA